MGSWGPGLYSNDLARDLRWTFSELVRLPITPGELVARLLQDFPCGSDSGDEDHTNFWLVTADLYYAYALGQREVFSRARHIIDSGADLKANRDLDMVESDLRKRARILEKLADKWSRPNPKPRARRVLEAPERLLFGAGELVVYPTQKGNAANALHSNAALRESFRPDAWGAFVVLSTSRRHQFFSCYLVARLFLETTARPTVDDCLEAPIAGLRPPIPLVPADPAVKVVSVTPTEAKKLSVQKIGSRELLVDALRESSPAPYQALDRPSWSLVGLLRPFSEGTVKITERPVALRGRTLSRFVRHPSGPSPGRGSASD